ncbi:hypothetical protein BJX61DRAFT_539019 [Aspergillus egyptiacus]|nr:hypothetical protein BJX61DRAFT_539019 [Aspergillus egyptiacus]
MEHLHSRIPYAQWRLRVFRQLFLPSVSSSPTHHSRCLHSTGQSNAHETRDTTTSTNNQQQDIDDVAADTNDDDTIVSPSSLLPQSPLITNPRPGHAQRHRTKSRPTADNLSDLRHNPWAVALASPVRQCQLSGARMPRAFLTDWGLVEGPSPPPDPNAKRAGERAGKKDQDEKRYWLLPVSLLKDRLDPKSSAQGQSKAVRPHLKMRMVDRWPLLEKLTRLTQDSRATKWRPVLDIIPFRWQPPFGPCNMREQSRIVWRHDMHEYLRKLMRMQVVKDLKAVSDTFKRQDVPNGVWRSIDVQGPPFLEEALLDGISKMETFDRMGSGVVLVLGEGVAGAGPALPELVTIPALGRRVPVFDLTRLFSQAELDDIRTHHERFQKFAIFLRPCSELGVNAVLSLWKLQGYVREPENPIYQPLRPRSRVSLHSYGYP